jgi:pimeloyl-ACP methyl ester carboxylesterase
VERKEVSFISGGEQIAAWVYSPHPEGSDPPSSEGSTPGASTGQTPALVMAHGFGGTREAGLPPYAERFAAAGMRVVVFDYRHFGGSTGEPRQLIDIGKQLDDWRAAIAFARGLDGVDPERVAIWGTSFAGGHAITIAAEDERLAAAVAQAPMADGLAVSLALGPARSLRLTRYALRDAIGAARGKPPVYVPLVAQPGELAAMTDDDADAGYHRLIPAVSTWQNRFAGRTLMRLPFYRPNRLAAEIACPLLVCICDRDKITPPEPAALAAERAPRGEAVHYDCRHFDIYVGELFEETVADQVAFLTRNLQQ